MIGVAAARLTPFSEGADPGMMRERVNFAIPINEAEWLTRKANPIPDRTTQIEPTLLPRKDIVSAIEKSVVLIFAKSVDIRAALPVDPLPSDSVQQIFPDGLQEFIWDYATSGESENLSYRLGFYRFPVSNYFGEEKLSSTQVAEDIMEYNKKWPERTYTPIGKLYLDSTPEYEGVFYANYSVSFLVENADRRISGTSEYTLLIDTDEDSYKIRIVKENVLNRKVDKK